MITGETTGLLAPDLLSASAMLLIDFLLVFEESFGDTMSWPVGLGDYLPTLIFIAGLFRDDFILGDPFASDTNWFGD